MLNISFKLRHNLFSGTWKIQNNKCQLKTVNFKPEIVGGIVHKLANKNKSKNWRI